MPRKIDLEGYRQVDIRTDGSFRCDVRGCSRSEVMIFERCDGGDCKAVCGRCYDGSGICTMCHAKFTRARHGREFRCESCGGTRKRKIQTCVVVGCDSKAKIRGRCMTHHKKLLNGCDICFSPGVPLREIPRWRVQNALWTVREVYPEAQVGGSRRTIFPCRPCINHFFTQCDRRLCNSPATESDYRCKFHTTKKRKLCVKCGIKPSAKDRLKCHACHKQYLRLLKCCQTCQSTGNKKRGCKDCQVKYRGQTQNVSQFD